MDYVHRTWYCTDRVAGKTSPLLLLLACFVVASTIIRSSITMPSFCFSLVLWNPSSIGSPIRGNPISTASPFLGRCLYGVHHSLYILLRSYVDVVGSLSVLLASTSIVRIPATCVHSRMHPHVDTSVCGIPSRTFSLLLCLFTLI